MMYDITNYLGKNELEQYRSFESLESGIQKKYKYRWKKFLVLFTLGIGTVFLLLGYLLNSGTDNIVHLHKSDCELKNWNKKVDNISIKELNDNEIVYSHSKYYITNIIENIQTSMEKHNLSILSAVNINVPANIIIHDSSIMINPKIVNKSWSRMPYMIEYPNCKPISGLYNYEISIEYIDYHTKEKVEKIYRNEIASLFQILIGHLDGNLNCESVNYEL